MTKVYLLLFPPLILLFGCTKNNQNSPANFAYLNVNETYVANANQIYQNYDIDNDGVIDWGFSYYTGFSDFVRLNPYNATPPSYLIDSATADGLKIPPQGFSINNTNVFSGISSGPKIFYKNPSYPALDVNVSLAGSGDFFIGFKSQNPQFTNTFFGWARLNLSADGKTLIVKDMALNTVNGGSINVGQH